MPRSRVHTRLIAGEGRDRHGEAGMDIDNDGWRGTGLARDMLSFDQAENANIRRFERLSHLRRDVDEAARTADSYLRLESALQRKLCT
jgi:hypothetical protein